MIIESVDQDEVRVKDDTKRIFNKKKFLISFDNGISRTFFDEEENAYRIILSKNSTPEKLDDLISCYDLIHEVHHLQKALLYPRWEADRVFGIKIRFDDFGLEEYLIEQFSKTFEGLKILDKRYSEEIKEKLRVAIAHFIIHVKSMPLPRPIAYLNAFEDMRIETHMRLYHSEIKKPANFSSNTLDNFSKALMELSNTIRMITGGFSVLFTIPFTSHEELSGIYEFYDLIVIVFRDYISPEDYYEDYYRKLRKFKKQKIPRKAYADRYRADLELKRIKSTLKELKKDDSVTRQHP